MPFQKDQVVKFAKPLNEYEETARFIVIEDRGDRVLVGEVVDPVKFPYGVTAVHQADDLVVER